MLDEEGFKKLLSAGSIASRVKDELRNIVRPGIRIRDLAEAVERKIFEYGGSPAFPVNISIDSIAAHYTPTPFDNSVLPESGLVKIDFGVHIDGFIVDTAYTIDLDDSYRILVEASQEALDRALSIIRPGVPLRDVGKVVQQVARKFDVKPIRNLSGHRIDRYNLHAGESVPNYNDLLTPWRFKDNSIYAVDPFITTGAGMVSEGKEVTIYALKSGKLKGLRGDEVSLVRYIIKEYKTLPFCSRWLSDRFRNADEIVKGLYSRKVFRGYPVLVEVKRKPEYGGDVVFESYEDLEKMYVSGRLHPLDLKESIAQALIEILEPVRRYFEGNKRARENLEIVRQAKITR
jgi:methionyl aminopeptidase